MKNSQLLITSIFIILASTILIWPIMAVSEDDIHCLGGIKEAFLMNPNNSLNWNSDNWTAGLVCTFTGVSCWWYIQDNHVHGLSLPSLSLSGQIPSALQYCSSLNSLDLSNNSLWGSVPAHLCDWLPKLVTLDLSGNDLTGPVPMQLSKCAYLYNLNLAGNQLTGTVPTQLSLCTGLTYLNLAGNQLTGPVPRQLSKCIYLSNLNLSCNQLSGVIPTSFFELYRLIMLDLSNNQLSGQVPEALAKRFNLSSFEGNIGLCGPPVSPHCSKRQTARKSMIIIIVAGVFGAVFGLSLAFVLWWFCFHSRKAAKVAVGAWDHSAILASLARLMSYKKTTVIIVTVFGAIGGWIGLTIAMRG